MRHLSQSCILSLARVIINSDCNEAKQLLIDTIKELFTLLCSKKNGRIVPKLFEELLVHRFPDFFIPVLLNDLIDAMCEGKSLFIKSELSKILMLVLKKSKGLEVTSKDLIKESLSKILESLLNALRQSIDTNESNSNTFKLSAKRAKPILFTLKVVLESLKEESIKNIKSINILKILQDLVQLLIENSKSASPVIEKLVENILVDTKLLVTKFESQGSSQINSNGSSKSIKEKKSKHVEKDGKRLVSKLDGESTPKVKSKKSKSN